VGGTLSISLLCFIERTGINEDMGEQDGIVIQVDVVLAALAPRRVLIIGLDDEDVAIDDVAIDELRWRRSTLTSC